VALEAGQFYGVFSEDDVADVAPPACRGRRRVFPPGMDERPRGWSGRRDVRSTLDSACRRKSSDRSDPSRSRGGGVRSRRGRIIRPEACGRLRARPRATGPGGWLTDKRRRGRREARAETFILCDGIGRRLRARTRALDCKRFAAYSLENFAACSGDVAGVDVAAALAERCLAVMMLTSRANVSSRNWRCGASPASRVRPA